MATAGSASDRVQVQGRVTDDEGRPLALAYVTFEPLVGNGYVLVRADTQGRYEISNLEPATYRVILSVHYSDWVPSTDDFIVEYWGADDLDPRAATLLHVTPGETVLGLHASLEAGSSISGHVTGQGLNVNDLSRVSVLRLLD